MAEAFGDIQFQHKIRVIITVTKKLSEISNGTLIYFEPSIGNPFCLNKTIINETTYVQRTHFDSI